MTDLRVAPGPGAPQGVVIPEAELVERFTHASGPGGQGVNTADSRVQLSWDLAASTALTPEQRARAVGVLGEILRIEASEHRSQHRNRAAARLRCCERCSDASIRRISPRTPTARARCSGVSAVLAARSQLSCTRESAVFTPWPPGPEAWVKRSTSSASGITTPWGAPGPGATRRSVIRSPPFAPGSTVSTDEPFRDSFWLVRRQCRPQSPAQRVPLRTPRRPRAERCPA